MQKKHTRRGDMKNIRSNSFKRGSPFQKRNVYNELERNLNQSNSPIPKKDGFETEKVNKGPAPEMSIFGFEKTTVMKVTKKMDAIIVFSAEM